MINKITGNTPMNDPARQSRNPKLGDFSAALQAAGIEKPKPAQTQDEESGPTLPPPAPPSPPDPPR